MLEKLFDLINATAKKLSLTENSFRAVRLNKYSEILEKITEKFLKIGIKGLSEVWWWESFKGETISCQSPNPDTLMIQSLPSGETFWFIASESWKEKTQYWLYEAKAEAISRIIKETSDFEYYIVSKNLDWLLCKNHHDLVVNVRRKILRDEVLAE